MTRPHFSRCVMIALLLFNILTLTCPVAAQSVRRGKYATEQQRRLQYALDDWISYTTSRHFTKIAAGTNYLYFATQDGGILRYHIYDNYWDYPFTTSNGLPSNNIINIAYDKKTSFLFAVTPNDIAVFNPASQEWISKSETPHWNYQFPEEEGAEGSNSGYSDTEKFFDRAALSNLPVFFANGAYSILGDWRLLDPDFQEFPITGYLRDRYDRIWFLVDGFGVGEGPFITQRANFFQVGLPDISPRALQFQGDDLWIGGVGDVQQGRPGIARWSGGQIGWDYYQARWISTLPSDRVSSIAVDGDSVWFGTDFGVSLYDSRENKWRNFNIRHDLSSNAVLDLAIFGDYVYVGTDYGVSRISRLTGRVERDKDPRLVNREFNRFAVQQDTLWAATFRGIYRLTRQTGVWELLRATSAIQDLEITAVAAGHNEAWFAAPGGVMQLNVARNVWESYPQISFEVRGPYRDIKFDSAAVWVATDDGLLKFDRRRLFWRLFTTEDGLLDNQCHRLLLDGDYLWIVTATGITQFYWNNPQRSDY